MCDPRGSDVPARRWLGSAAAPETGFCLLLCRMRRASNVIGSRQGDTNHSVFAMGSHGHQGALSLNFCWPMRPKFWKGSALHDRREVTMTMREYEERFRSPPPSLHQIFVGIRGPNPSRQRIRAVAALVGGLIAGGGFRRFQTFSLRAMLGATLKFEEPYGCSHASADRVNRNGRQSCSSNVVPSRLSTNCLTISRCNFLCDAMG